MRIALWTYCCWDACALDTNAQILQTCWASDAYPCTACLYPWLLAIPCMFFCCRWITSVVSGDIRTVYPVTCRFKIIDCWLEFQLHCSMYAFVLSMFLFFFMSDINMNQNLPFGVYKPLCVLPAVFWNNSFVDHFMCFWACLFTLDIKGKAVAFLSSNKSFFYFIIQLQCSC